MRKRARRLRIVRAKSPNDVRLVNYGHQPFHGEVAGSNSDCPKYGDTIWASTDRCGAPFDRAARTGRRVGWLHPGEGRGQYRAAGAEAADRTGAAAEGVGPIGWPRPNVCHITVEPAPHK